MTTPVLIFVCIVGWIALLRLPDVIAYFEWKRKTRESFEEARKKDLALLNHLRGTRVEGRSHVESALSYAKTGELKDAIASMEKAIPILNKDAPDAP